MPTFEIEFPYLRPETSLGLSIRDLEMDSTYWNVFYIPDIDNNLISGVTTV